MSYYFLPADLWQLISLYKYNKDFLGLPQRCKISSNYYLCSIALDRILKEPASQSMAMLWIVSVQEANKNIAIFLDLTDSSPEPALWEL